MSTTPHPRHVAEALAELSRERVLEARAYLDAWASLVRSGVPAHAVRHFLDRDQVPTPSTEAVKAWRGRSGTLLLIGNRGCGKSNEGVRWLHERHLEGRPGRWLSCSSWLRLTFEDQRAVLKLAASAPALVVDDIGAGGSSGSSDASAKLNGLLLERFEDDLPTLVCLNGELQDVTKWLDARLVSRLEVGGDMVKVDFPSLRSGEADDINHPQCPCGGRGRKCGHGTAWRHNHEIIEFMGCEMTARATGANADGPTREVWRTGLQLVLGANNRRNRQASELLGIHREAVLELAAVKAANDKTPSLQAELNAAMLRLAKGVADRSESLGDIRELSEREEDRVRARMRACQESHEDARAALEVEIMQERANAAGRRADNIARAKRMHDAMALPTKGRSGVPWSDDSRASHTGRKTMESKPPEWTQDRARLKKLGFEVKSSPTGFDVLYQDRVRLKGLGSPDVAWGQAAVLAGMGW